MDDIVRSLWRHKEPGGNDLVHFETFEMRNIVKNGPKVGFAALVKSGQLLETPVYPPVLATQGGSNNLRGADNQQERLLRKMYDLQSP